MLFDVENLAPFTVIGYAIRTDNTRAKQDIAVAWEYIMRNNILENLPNREDRDIIAVYTDYETDFNGPYTYILGCRVTKIDNIPKDLVARRIPGAQYAHMRFKGRFPQRLQKGWEEIWKSELPRSYGSDFEIYGARYDGSDHAELDVFVSIQDEAS